MRENCYADYSSTSSCLLHTKCRNKLCMNANGGKSEDYSSIDDDVEFSPNFDGQLYYGLAADSDGNVETSLSELRAKSGNNAQFDLSLPSLEENSDISETKKTLQPDKEFPKEEFKREKAVIRRVPILSRTVPLRMQHDPSLTATVWEMEKPSELVEVWMSGSSSDKDKIRDPFGVVYWPGSILAAQEMGRKRKDIEGKSVLILGAGLGLEAQAAALLGAKNVIATDVNKFTLALLRFGAERANLDNVIEARVFDLFSEEKLPICDVVVIADVLYNERLASVVGKRCQEVLERKPRPRLLVTDSQRFHGTDFLAEINKGREVEDALSWESGLLTNVTGSGILIEEDQTYDVKTRMLSLDGDF